MLDRSLPTSSGTKICLKLTNFCPFVSASPSPDHSDSFLADTAVWSEAENIRRELLNRIQQ